MADTAATNVHDDNRRSRDEVAPAAAKGATIPVTVVLLVLLVASVAAFLMVSPPPGMEAAGGENGGAARTGAEPVEQAVGDGVPGFNSRLDAFRTWAKLTWMKLHRPHSDEPRFETGAGIAGSAAEATKKSMKMGKETAEQAAATAAGAAGMANDKVKGVAAPSPDAEL